MKIGYTTQNMDLSPWREGEKPFLVLGILDALLDCSFNYSVYIKKKIFQKELWGVEGKTSVIIK